MKNYKIIIFLITVFSLVSCDLDLLDDPNNSTPDNANINYLLASVQTELDDLYHSINGKTMQYTRMQYQFGDYVGGPTDFNSVWYNYYTYILPENRLIIEKAENEGFPRQAGMAKVMESYATILLVDMFGDIPYSEAAQGTDFINPKSDDAEGIYNKIFSLLDEAKADLQTEDAPSLDADFDIYYGGDIEKWIRLANTLKLKMYVQTKLVDQERSRDGINALITEDMLINSSDQDFQFSYGTNVSSPDTRHPTYAANYNSSGVGNYMSNSYMYALKNTNDPRLRYYFYRQDLADPDAVNPAFLVCTLPPDPPYSYCYIGDGYWGRDHTIEAGIPSDAQHRTTWGVYPVGGAFDHDQAEPADEGDGAGGAGIAPYMLSSFVNFMLAEAVLTIPGVNGNAAAYYENGITQSINKVKSFGTLNGVTLGGMQPTSAEINTFIADRVNLFNAATDLSEKMELLMTQYWIALRGNGIEAYNTYRRTGYPTLQSPLSSGTNFPRINQYPAVHVNNNTNAVQQPITDHVFWDTNPANFID